MHGPGKLEIYILNEDSTFFTDSQNEDSAKMLRHLELVDGEAVEYGVRVVKMEDALIAKKYGHRYPPGLGYFRQGDYVKYDGEMS